MPVLPVWPQEQLQLPAAAARDLHNAAQLLLQIEVLRKENRFPEDFHNIEYIVHFK